uniref:Uncharacterized protein n=1 Tax=Seriola lalandi dorsalis TaxID=1841481 RepID=A0A3B4WF42_SERLL
MISQSIQPSPSCAPASARRCSPDIVLNTDELLLCCVVYRLTFPRGHFPRLAECAHFHYETVDFGNVQVSLENTYSVTSAAESYYI